MDNSSDFDFRFPFSPAADAHHDSAAFAAASSSTCFDADSSKPHKKPRKKRSKLVRIDDDPDPAAPNRIARPKYSRKPDPSAPKITKPCSECGKKFWSWKALFGHMRCHPERQWRGIDPPPNVRRPISPTGRPLSGLQLVMGEADHEAASSLLMLASGGSPTIDGPNNEIGAQSLSTGTYQGANEVFDGVGTNGKFECSSCKKVFGSHQALGGHRASHKNVKGCFAITKSDGEVDQDSNHLSHQIVDGIGDHDVTEVSNVSNVSNVVMVLGQGHKCNICWRVFASGQALGGHMRCHWDKGEEMIQLGLSQQPGVQLGLGLDLNVPANAAAPAPAVSASNVEDDQSSSYLSSGLTLDLRLGL